MLIGLGMLLWPVVEALPALLSQRYSPLQIVWVRYATHLVLMLVVWAPIGPGRLVRTGRPGLHALRAATMLGMPVAFVLARMRMSSDVVMSIFWIEALLVLVLARAWLGERVSRRGWVATGVAVAGAPLVLGADGPMLRLAAVIPLAMAVCFAVYQVLTRAMREETTAARLFYTALGVWAPLSLGLPWFWTTPTLPDLAVLMSIGVLGFGFLLALDRALDLAPASVLAPFALAQPIWSVTLHAALRGTVPSGESLAGIAVVLGAWLVFAWPARGRREPPAV